jgi:cytochrome b
MYVDAPDDEDLRVTEQKWIEVWDWLVRTIHWSLVALFAAAYISEGEPVWLHSWIGYSIAGLLLVRVLWGFVGSAHARFTDFVRSPAEVLRYIREELAGRARRYLGHNPAGGLMVLVLMMALGATAISGMALLAAEEGQGPLAGWLIATSHPVAEVIEEIHEVFANLSLLLIAIHVIGVVFVSLHHRENLARAMVDGHKRLLP